MTQSILLVLVTAVVTWFVMRWARSAPARPKPLSMQEREAEHAKDVGYRLDGARDQASKAELERNRLALAKGQNSIVVRDARLLTSPCPNC